MKNYIISAMIGSGIVLYYWFGFEFIANLI